MFIRGEECNHNVEIDGMILLLKCDTNYIHILRLPILLALV